jgi:hypothetical protein
MDSYEHRAKADISQGFVENHCGSDRFPVVMDMYIAKFVYTILGVNQSQFILRVNNRRVP